MGLKPMLIFVMEEGGGHPSQLPSFGGFPVDPGYGVSAPGYPSQGLPGQGGHPSHGLPGQGGLHPGNSLPAVPPQIPVTKPSPQPPAGGGTEKPSTLPTLPSGTFILVWYPGLGWAAVPVDGAHPDQSLPGGQPPHVSGQPVPGQPPHASGQPVPPQPTPTPQGRR